MRIRSSTVPLWAVSLLQVSGAYWMENIKHQGISPFNPDPSGYQVFRNVRDFGAVGDGITDDTAAIQAAISSGNRCGFDEPCIGLSIAPATVYFPAGTYVVSSSVFDYYYTQLIGDPTSMPVIKAASDFKIMSGFGMIDGDKYQMATGHLTWVDTDVFFRQIRNLVFDTTAVSPELSITAIHWPTAQASSIQNVILRLAESPGTKHVGIFMEGGSGGYMGDLVFYGGNIGAQFGNQQYTMRNLTFVGCVTAIQQLWNWYWVYRGLTIVDCGVGINMTADGFGSAIVMDSFFYNTDVAMVSAKNTTSSGNMQSQGSLVLQNVLFTNVSSILQGSDAMVQDFGYHGTFISGQILGNTYTPTGPHFVNDGLDEWFPSPAALKGNGSNQYYARSKPQYVDVPVDMFVSPRSFGATGDGRTDDTNALNVFFSFVSQHFSQGYVGFVDAGYYKVTDTVYIPPNCRIVGEALATVILGAGPNFSDLNIPRPVVRVGNPGETGSLEWSDMLVSTQGGTAGAILIEYNLAPCGCDPEPAGMWDIHIRVGGFAGSDLQVGNCPKTPEQPDIIYSSCIAAYMGMHITDSASNLYMENNWFWIADHDIDDPTSTQLSIYGGRGFLIESKGPIWAVASASEHWTLYQYQLHDAENIWMGQIQTETPYYQPNPPAPYPFDHIDTALNDPDFVTDCSQLNQGAVIEGANVTAPCQMAWALRIIDSSNIVIYGPGLYSFFNNYDTTCSDGPYGGFVRCQSRIVSIEDSTGESENVVLYDLFTIGTISMVTNNGNDVALWKDNWNVFGESLSLFQARS